MVGTGEAWVVVARPAEPPAALRAWLDAADQAHVARFRRPEDRLLATCSRIVQRWTIAAAAGVAPEALRFAAGPHGRPQLVAPAAGDLCFSVTNTAGLVACAVARAGAIGVDAEPLDRPLPPELLDTCCSTAERAALAALPPAAQGAWFHRLWTLKEAWFKARGLGIDREPSGVGFAFDARSALVRAGAGPADGWRFRLLDAGPGHALALCADAPRRVRVTRIGWDAGAAIRAEVAADDVAL